ncbi:MAG: hypothetical protein WCD57_26025 [Acidobacteriaceae bacterium]
MKFASATNINRKSGVAERRDLRFRGPLVGTQNPVPPQICHLACPGVPWDRSEADLSRLPRPAVGRAVEGPAVLRFYGPSVDMLFGFLHTL